MPLKAVIFDLDGVLVDTSKFHAKAWADLVRGVGIEPPPDLEERVKGISRLASVKIALGARAADFSDAELHELAERKNACYVAAIETVSPADLYPGVLKLFRDLRRHGVRICLGSASKNARPVLERLGIMEWFDAIADGFAYRHGKPHPDVFLTAARLIGADPHDCIVVEDATAGINAALDGGFVAVAMGNYESLKHAHLFVNSLTDLSCRRLAALLERFSPAEWRVRCAGGRGELETADDGDLLLAHSGKADLAPAELAEMTWLNTPNFIDARIVIAGEAVDFTQGELKSLSRSLDLHNATFTVEATWRSPAGREVRILQRRFADLASRGCVWFQYEIEPLNFSGPLQLTAQIDAQSRVPLCDPQPGYRTVERAVAGDNGVVLVIAGSADHAVAACGTAITVLDRPAVRCAPDPQAGTVSVTTTVEQGHLLYLDRVAIVVTERLESASTATAAERQQAALAAAQSELRAAGATSYGAARIAHGAAWNEYWAQDDSVSGGHATVQRATRFRAYRQRLAAAGITGCDSPALAAGGSPR